MVIILLTLMSFLVSWKIIRLHLTVLTSGTNGVYGGSFVPSENNEVRKRIELPGFYHFCNSISFVLKIGFFLNKEAWLNMSDPEEIN